MRRGVGKRGLSPVVASMFLILLIVILAILIFLWFRGFIGERIEKFGEPIEEVCSRVSFEVSKSGGDSLEILNKGDVDIKYFAIEMSDGKGNSEMTKLMFSADANEAIRESVALEMKDGGDAEKIVVYPVLVGIKVSNKDNNIFTCMNEGVVI